MATFRTLFSNPTMPSHDHFSDQLKAAQNTARLLDVALQNKITCLAIRIWEPRFHKLNFLQYQTSYAFTSLREDPQGKHAWDIGRLVPGASNGSQSGTIVLQTEEFLKGIFTFVDGEWKLMTPA